MSRRISRQTLEARIQTINEMAGTPTHSWTISSPYETPRVHHANIGNYHISSYSPGDRHGTRYSLEQMSNESGGVRTVLPTVCGSENFLDCLNALIEGMRISRENFGKGVAA